MDKLDYIEHSLSLVSEYQRKGFLLSGAAWLGWGLAVFAFGFIPGGLFFIIVPSLFTYVYQLLNKAKYGVFRWSDKDKGVLSFIKRRLHDFIWAGLSYADVIKYQVEHHPKIAEDCQKWLFAKRKTVASSLGFGVSRIPAQMEIDLQNANRQAAITKQ